MKGPLTNVRPSDPSTQSCVPCEPGSKSAVAPAVGKAKVLDRGGVDRRHPNGLGEPGVVVHHRLKENICTVLLVSDGDTRCPWVVHSLSGQRQCSGRRLGRLTGRNYSKELCETCVVPWKLRTILNDGVLDRRAKSRVKRDFQVRGLVQYGAVVRQEVCGVGEPLQVLVVGQGRGYSQPPVCCVQLSVLSRHGILQ